MKIIYIANARFPTEKAHGIQIAKMCEAFTEAGNEVELVLPRRFNPIKEDPFEYYGIKRNFKITRLPCLDLIILDKYIGHLGLWVESFTFLTPVFFYTLFKKADIFYTRNALLLPLALFKRNLFFEAHTFPKKYFLYSLFLKRTPRLIVITQKLKDIFAERGADPEKILVAPDGVDLEKFDIKETKEECRARLSLAQDKKIVLYTGHLYPWKGVQTLAEASQFLPEDVKVYFVGGTTKDREEFAMRNAQFKIKVMGHRPHSEIPYWLKAADVLVLPNSAKEDISKYWTSPMKLFEYMTSSRPIVASDLPSFREVLSEKNSILAEADNPEKLAAGIKKALDNPELSKSITEKAFLDVKQYTWEERARKISDRFF
ncbi:MAG: glycosyltransferase family 4 protein [Candidatus Nealsonbacteria bacterium]|nr:glycosyltransferase family 4 protein [Candidatus Nealsonbacteria bacterium]